VSKDHGTASINESGSIFGEMSAFMERPNSVTATARSAVQVHAFDELDVPRSLFPSQLVGDRAGGAW
jgi:CRP-like cAMP-binding protein